MKKYFNILLFFIGLVIIPITVLGHSNNSDQIITGEYQFSAIEGSNKQLQNTFVYKDSDFTKSSFKGSKSLEILSIQAAAASLSWYGEKIDKYEIDYSQNDHNIKDFLSKMEFNNIESNKYYNSEKKENSMGVIVGHKTIIQDGKEYTLLAIIPRSAGYKQEWAGNFTIGAGDIHEGFKSARDEILRFTKKYIEKNKIKGNLKVWTTGYSRGAAVSNMIGGFFAGGGIDYFGNDVSITPEDVYCYTIGTPSSIKNGASKNVELSVSANRSTSDYVNDTEGISFNYTKGGTVLVTDTIYNGVRNILSPDDAFPLLPPEDWGFTRYGKVIDSYDSLYSIDEMLKELKSISEYVYGAYTNNGKILEFNEKTFDLKTLSIVNKENSASQIEFFKDRLNGMVSRIGTNKIYSDEYQTALKSAIGTYGMAANLIDDISTNNSMSTSDMIYPLIYSYLAYVSDELQNEGKANSEKEAITIAAEDLLTYFIGGEINRETFTIDDFVKLVLKYIADNEGEPVSDAAISGIINLVPKEYQFFLSMFKVFAKSSDASTEESLKSFIRACYYGVDPESEAYLTYQEPEQARELLYRTMLFSQGSEIPELENLMMSKDGKLDGHGKFEDFIELMLQKVKEEKDDDGNIVKTYSNIASLADKELTELLENLLSESIEKSEELHGLEYKEDFQKQFNGLKQNITQVREIISSLFFYTEDGYNIGKSIENTITFIDNASLIAMPHFDEIYLALARTSNRYDDEYECIKGNGQSYNPLQDKELSIVFSFDYYLFIEKGELYIDGVVVPKENYKISKGSTVITLNNSYLKTLTEGNHTMTLKMDDKEADANFTITNEKITNPKTGDSIILWISVLIISILGIVCVLKFIKKK